MRLFVLLPLLGLVACPVFAEPEPEAALSYAIGTRLGERLHDEVPNLQLDALLRGLQQAYDGSPLELSRERIDQLLMAHEALLAEQQKTHAPERAAETRFLVQQKAAYGVREMPGGVLVSELRKGQSGKPMASKEVQVLYVGMLADGSRFDASEKPQWFKLDSVIAGWRTALSEMPVGAKWRIVVPADQAYGAEGAGDLIPPFAPLVFEVELLDRR